MPLSRVAGEIGLSEEQVRSFRDDGFLVIDDVFPPQDVELLREAAASPEVMRDWRKTEHATTTVPVGDRREASADDGAD
jgi:hypothetical protein